MTIDNEQPMWGTLRISNPKTLQRWLDTGLFQAQLDKGYIFATGCGRFKIEVCTCSACRKFPKTTLKELIDKYNQIKQ
jgi:hypothetical protein